MCHASLGVPAPHAPTIPFSFQFYYGGLDCCSFKCLRAPGRNFPTRPARIRADNTHPPTSTVLDFSRRYISFHRPQDFVLCWL
ncbi:hypothetical protein BDN71DRAFT_1456945 [Pleurotus eryngii]|uniref:Uncharacterized protein n=1 Tax=Pleurotus eryngii TaxID=5323 RepID=A0A9P5ZK46_PLEER|nr:hypothetical protein BDN71DRAFT_1456945 [Pleurotus eryngii]